MYEQKSDFLESISRRSRKGFEPQYKDELQDVAPSTERLLGTSTLKELVNVNQTSSIVDPEAK